MLITDPPLRYYFWALLWGLNLTPRKEDAPGVDGEKCAMVGYDEASETLVCYPQAAHNKREAIAALKVYMAKRMDMPFFANARTIRNAIDLARMRAAIRIFNEKTAAGSDGMVTEAELQLITGADFPSVSELEEMGEEAISA